MKKIVLIFLSFTITTAFMFGCSSRSKCNAIRTAADNNLIQGFSASNKFPDAIVWQFPGEPWGVIYSEVGSAEARVAEGPEKGRLAVFFLGKSKISKQWEVFAVQMWKEGRWNLIPVTLPETKKKQ